MYHFLISLHLQAPYNEVRYFISSVPASAQGAQYFMVDSLTGNISLRQSPMLDSARTVDYTVIFFLHILNS